MFYLFVKKININGTPGFCLMMKAIKTKAIQLSEIALLGGNVEDAELLLLQKGLVFRAIFLNIRMHHWSR